MDATTLYPHFQMPIAQMEPPPKPSAASLFQVYLRLKPTISQAAKSTRFLTVNQSVSSADDSIPAHITVVPPTESRRRAVEKFAFTRIFEEDATQLDILRSSGIVPLIEGVIGTESHAGRDGLIAALGMSGSGKSHTILGDSRTQRGITQMGLDLIFRSLGKNVVHPKNDPSMTYTLTVSDTAEAHIQTADSYLDGIYGEAQHGAGGGFSRAATPMSPVGRHSEAPPQFPGAFPRDSCSSFVDRAAALLPRDGEELEEEAASVAAVATASSQLQRSPSKLGRAYAKLKSLAVKDGHSLDILPPPSRKKLAHRPDAFPTQPDVASLAISAVQSSDYAVLISMYEVHNDRIFDLLSPSSSTTPNQHHHHQTSILRANQNQNQNQKDLRRRALLFKATEQSGDRKVVAGLTKVVCGDLKEALTVLETGLLERKVTGTGSNAVSSRSHGFFCIELMRRTKGGRKHWLGSTLTIVDLAGSERARNAKTAGATLAEGGKINESLMFLGQCLQMQSDNTRETNRPGLVPFRQCKLTELLFTNFFPSSSVASSSAAGAGGCSHVRAAAMPAHDPQKAVMIVTADPLGDFNATSQILRYSSLAREVTVPRVPSLPAALANTSASRPASAGYGTRNRTPNMISDPSGPSAASEEQIQHLTTSLELLNHQLAEETLRRHVAERAWEATELRMDVLEMEVREECFADLEARLETERRRWLEAWAEEGERADERVDRKLAILGRGLEGDGEEVGAIGGGRALVHEGAGRRVEDLERENAALRERLEELSRALAGSQPVAAASSASSDAVPLDLGKTAPLSREPQPAEKEESPKKHPQPQPQPQPSPQKNASRRSTRLALQPTPNPQRQSRVHSSPLPDVPDAPSMDSEDSCSTVRLGHTPEASTDMDTDVDKENRTSITSSSSSTTTPACTTAAEPTPAVQTLQLDTELMARTPVRLVSSSNGNANGGATGGATGPRRGVARSTGKKTTALRALTGRRWDLGGLEGEGEE